MFWKIILFVVAWTIGQVTASATVIMPLCCLRMGIPFTNQVQKETGIDLAMVKRTYKRSAKLWLVIDLIIISILFWFVPLLYAVAFAAGTFLTLLIGFRQTGINENNIMDFLRLALPKLEESEQITVLKYVNQKHDIDVDWDGIEGRQA